jgi:histidinol-phosphate aminotransferase
VLSRRLGIPVEKHRQARRQRESLWAGARGAGSAGRIQLLSHLPRSAANRIARSTGRLRGAPAAHILPTHGADELLDYLCRLFLRPGDAIIDCPPTFGMYSFDAQLGGGRVIEVWRGADFAVDVAAVEQIVASSRCIGRSCSF